MFPDLFAHPAAQPPSAAGVMPGDATAADTTSAADVFADLLSAIDPGATERPAAAAAPPVSLALGQLWLAGVVGAPPAAERAPAMQGPTVGQRPETELEDELGAPIDEAATGPSSDDASMAWAHPVPVPVPAPIPAPIPTVADDATATSVASPEWVVKAADVTPAPAAPGTMSVASLEPSHTAAPPEGMKEVTAAAPRERALAAETGAGDVAVEDSPASAQKDAAASAPPGARGDAVDTVDLTRPDAAAGARVRAAFSTNVPAEPKPTAEAQQIAASATAPAPPAPGATASAELTHAAAALQNAAADPSSKTAATAATAAAGARSATAPQPGPVAAEPSNDQGQSPSGNAGQQSAPAPALAPALVPGGSPAPAPEAAFTVTVDPTGRVALSHAVASPLPPSTGAQDVENITRLVESMHVQWRQGVPEATVRLRPEHLGEVTISIRVANGAVSAVVHAETPAGQQWLEAQEDRLRSGLADQGLQLEKFVVRERQPDRREQRQPHQQPRYRQPREDAPRFEVSA